MTITYAQLNAAQPEKWFAAFDDWMAVANNLANAAMDLKYYTGPISEDIWTGPTSQQAVATVNTTINELYAGQIECEAIAQVLQGMGEVVALAKQTLAEAKETAAAHHLTIRADGTVVDNSPAPPPYAPGAHPQPPVGTLLDPNITQVTSLINEALREVNQADASLGARLHTLSGTAGQTDPEKAENNDLNPATQAELAALGGAIPTGPPAFVTAWWNGLTPPEQVKLALAEPGIIGSLQGIPANIQNALRGGNGIDRVALVNYALKNYQNYESGLGLDGRTHHVNADDCTGFASQALAAAGLAQINGPRKDTANYWYGPANVGINPLTHQTDSYSWVKSDGLHNFLTHNNSTEVPLSQARPGDILFWEQTGPGTADAPHGTMHHTAVVTGVLDGQIFYTQHSGSAQNANLSVREPFFEQHGANPQTVHVVRPAQDDAPPVVPYVGP